MLVLMGSGDLVPLIVPSCALSCWEKLPCTEWPAPGLRIWPWLPSPALHKPLWWYMLVILALRKYKSGKFPPNAWESSMSHIIDVYVCLYDICDMII